MTVAGTIYGIMLNDRREQQALAAAFREKPYGAPPVAPVVYIKPRACLAASDAEIALPKEVARLVVAPTVALLFARDACKLGAGQALRAVGAACLALDVSIPETDYHRPGVAQRCRDGFLPLGVFGDPALPREIVTHVDGALVHRWSLDRLVRDVSTLIVELSSFMTLRAGDALLIGLPGDAPLVRAGQSVTVAGGNLPSLAVTISADGQ